MACLDSHLDEDTFSRFRYSMLYHTLHDSTHFHGLIGVVEGRREVCLFKEAMTMSTNSDTSQHKVVVLC